MKHTCGFCILMIGAIFMLVMLLLGQTMSFIDYDFTVSLGLQESVDSVSELGVAMNKGFGVGDTIVYVPLFIIGIIGLWLNRKWGHFAMIAAMAITAYWPMVIVFFLLFARDAAGFNFSNYLSYFIFLSLITIYGIWGMFYLFKNKIE